ncbi:MULTISPECIES: hypothetical protein [Streptomyces]|uniref:Uncharacterized protein n=2 Tax=Streptomyces TaxID=1883 RepID=A0ABT9KS21_9ACTN|nr:MULTISPECIES: hypothetical protein [Streptomyces]MDN3056090.1 hypothetical protein [Streptomyces sp. SRF1]MDP9611238.1 hypothetical protein [Streptomyces demainii]GHJ29662.1 hypothetical protein TPA0910_40950 [Streptomyces hygroscopicus]GLV79739.1 hypothetical protein Shyhy02_77390 [Streptomyces hygroscopicus subsp. hygroscopicus]
MNDDHDLDLAVRLLADTPTHEGRDPALLGQWARTASEFGRRMTVRHQTVRVVERDGGLEAGLFARYRSRPPVVEVYADTVARAERLVAERGWRHWFPEGSVRAAALAHEQAHAWLHHAPVRAEFKRALGHTALRLGRRRLYAYVAGADEIAAHAYAQTACGLGRSPLLLTEALAAAVSFESEN